MHTRHSAALGPRGKGQSAVGTPAGSRYVGIVKENDVLARVFVYTLDDRLRRALLARLRTNECLEVSGGDELPDAGLFSVVLAPNVDLTPGECAELTGQGAKVILLAAVMREEERARYLASGASSYVAMNIDIQELQGELVRLACPDRHQPCPAHAMP